MQNRCVYTRDPLAARLDPIARRFISYAYEEYGAWAGWLLPPPGPRARTWMTAHGISPYERDRWGELRYVRAFKRSVYWTVKWYGGTYELRGSPNTASGGAQSVWGAPVRVQWETGRLVEVPGQFLPAQACRIRLWPATEQTRRTGHERALRLDENWIDEDGVPNERQSHPDRGDRPWEDHSADTETMIRRSMRERRER
jgi:hypothetical protein